MMKPEFIPLDFPRDPLNRHYDPRRTWLAWREPDSSQPSLKARVGHFLVRLGQRLEGQGPRTADGHAAMRR